MSNHTFVNPYIGFFVISGDLIKDDLNLAIAILKDILIVDAEYKYYDNCIHYTGISDKFFEAVPKGEIPYTYRAEVEISEELGTKVTWIRA